MTTLLILFSQVCFSAEYWTIGITVVENILQFMIQNIAHAVDHVPTILIIHFLSYVICY